MKSPQAFYIYRPGFLLKNCIIVKPGIILLKLWRDRINNTMKIVPPFIIILFYILSAILFYKKMIILWMADY